jgi:ABC-type glycerol-3-phosphate transport system substrate-binding protein
MLASCGGNDADTARSTTIRFWHFWSEPSQRAAINSLVAEFERIHHTKVEVTELSWNDGKAKLQAAFNSGSPPDVIDLGSDWIAQFSSAGVLLPLPIDSSVVNRFVPYSLGPAMWKSTLYAYPWIIDTRVLYVNPDLLDSTLVDGALVSLDDLQLAAESANNRGAYGFGTVISDQHRSYKRILPFMWMFGGDVVDAEGRVTLNTPQNIAAFEQYAELSRTGPRETQHQLDAQFVQGRLALWISGSWLIPKLRAAANVHAQARLMPGVEGKPGLSFAGGEYVAVAAATKNTQRSRELAQFLTNGKQALRLCRQLGDIGFPADKGTLADTTLRRDPMKAVFAEQLASARMTPVHPQWLDIEAILESAVDRVLLGNSTAAESLQTAQEEADQLIVGSR